MSDSYIFVKNYIIVLYQFYDYSKSVASVTTIDKIYGRCWLYFIFPFYALPGLLLLI